VSSAASPGCAAPPPPPGGARGAPAASASWATPPNETQSIPTAILELPSSSAVKQYRVDDLASLEGIADVFNQKNICDAIKGDPIQLNGKTYLKAAVAMSFPRWIMHDCILTLVIDESKVGDLAKALFNAQVKSQQHKWSLIFPGGSEVVPSPELIVKGGSDSAILDVFGPNICEAVLASSMREEALAGGIAHGVSMTFPANSSDTVVINLTLETVKGSEIREKIFPRIILR
jgi:hypothetical protein